MNTQTSYTEHYAKKWSEMNTLAAKLTGYISGKAKWDESVPVKARKEMLNYLIQVWSELNDDSPMTKEWIKEWEKEIEKLSK